MKRVFFTCKWHRKTWPAKKRIGRKSIFFFFPIFRSTIFVQTGVLPGSRERRSWFIRRLASARRLFPTRIYCPVPFPSAVLTGIQYQEISRPSFSLPSSSSFFSFACLQGRMKERGHIRQKWVVCARPGNICASSSNESYLLVYLGHPHI